MSDKIVKYDFFIVRAFTRKGSKITNSYIDLSPLLKEYMKRKVVDRTIEYGSEKVRMQLIKIDDEKIWEIQFVKLRDNAPSGIAYDDGKYEDILLAADEHIGEFNSVLYYHSNKLNILGMHRNQHALGPNGLKYYFDSLLDQQQIWIELEPIINLDAFSRIRKAYSVRSLNFRVNVAIEETITNKSLHDIIQSTKEIGGKFVTYTANVVGRGKIAPMKKREVLKMISELNNENAEKLKIGIKQNEDSAIETIDLLENRMRFNYKFEVDKLHPLKHISVYRHLLEVFKKQFKEGIE